ncbi:DNA-binding response regulator, partial [bacterium 1xD42-87]
ITIRCESFYGGTALTGVISEQRSYFDLIYLDIEMDDMNGIHTALQLRDLALPVLIVYVSAHEEYLKELFRTEPFRFLSKPVKKTELREVFHAACRRIQSRSAYYSFSYKKALHKVPFDRIAYFESRGRQIYIHISGPAAEDHYTEVFYGKMNEVEQQISAVNNRFLRIHQSFLVNFDYIRVIRFSEVVMMDGQALQISEERQKNARMRFCLMMSSGDGKEITDG